MTTSPHDHQRSPVPVVASPASSRRSAHRAKYLPDFSGELIDGRRYLLMSCLGTGGYGKVYKALDTKAPAPAKDPSSSSPSTSRHQRFVAIKCLSKPKDGSRQYRAQRRELKFHASVSKHANIISFFDAFCDHSYVYMVLDLCDGGDLFKAIVDKKVYHEKDDLIKTVFTQVVDAVAYCHSKHIFHRDLKPENILCNEEGSNILLTDFGLATDRVVTSDHGVGSSFYMSYENVNFDEGDYETAKNDIWSCGVILINMVTGRNPWMKALDEDECFAYYLKNEDFLLEVLPLSQHANNIVKQVLHPRPDRRMTLTELRSEVQSVDSFLLTSEDLENAPSQVQAAAKEAAASRKPTSYPLRTSSSVESYGQVIASSPCDDLVVQHPIVSVPPASATVSSCTRPHCNQQPAILRSPSLCPIPSADSDMEVEAITPEDALGPVHPPGIHADDDIPVLEIGETEVDQKQWGTGFGPGRTSPFRKAFEKIRKFSGVHDRGLELL
ncbi:kinase-like domain-containing protein [Flagelloscypha sp. PMI_526]|nr:kinase-like domain-containing protein [Flagelloscypha sp. PMI_526]